jgi:hypothetical protein
MDDVPDIAVDGNGDVYVTGETWSSDFPSTAGVYDGSYNGYDGYVAVLNPELSTLRHSTFLGGTDRDACAAIALDNAGSVYVTGNTYSDDFPVTPGCLDGSYEGDEGYWTDAFVTVLDSKLATVPYSTYLGGDGPDYGYDLVLDGVDNLYVAGNTGSEDFPVTSGAYDSVANYTDGFLTVLAPSRSAIAYSSFLGGRGNDYPWAIALGNGSGVYITGSTSSDDFPTSSGSYDGYIDDSTDAFVSRLSPETELCPDEVAPTSLTLSLEEWTYPGRSLQAGVWVRSEATEAVTYTVRVSLSQAGETPITREAVTTASQGNTPCLPFDFGVQQTGNYSVLAEALLNESVIASQPGHTQVPSSTDAAQALTAGAELTRAAQWELNEGQESVVWAYGESVPGLVSEAIGFVTGRLLKLISPVGEAALVPNHEISEASEAITGKVLAVEQLIEAGTRPSVERLAHQVTDVHLGFDRLRVDEERHQYDNFVMSHGVSWSSEHAQLVSEHWDIIRSRVEEERSIGPAAPASLFLPLSLKGRETILLIYKGVGAIVSTLLILACVALLIWAIVGSGGGALPGVIINLARLKPILGGLKSISAILLVLLAVEMDLQLDNTVAQAIRDRHQQALHQLQGLLQEPAQTNWSYSRQYGSIMDSVVTLSGPPFAQSNAADERSLTKLYAADGRLLDLEINSTSADANPGIPPVDLPHGAYRRVSSIPVQGDLGRGARVESFQVEGPQVELDLSLVTSQLEVSETLQSKLWVTNTDSITGTGPLGLVVEASDGENGEAWLVELEPEESQTFDVSFVPPSPGSYVLRARLFGPQASVLALREMGYVVGSGSAMAVEASCADSWQPGETVTGHVTVTNWGNEPAAGVVKVVTWDQEAGQPVYTTTLPLDLGSGDSEQHVFTLLSDAQPGRYSVNLQLNGESYLAFPFLVSAENTLLVVAEADPRYAVTGHSI